jgi:hypothetical protein
MDFSQVEGEFERLKAQFEAGAFTEAEFKARLEDLMIQDEQDRWWMIGFETGQWYYHDGQKWVQSEPPPVIERRREQVEALSQEGAAALAAGDWGAAIERYEAARALEAGHPEATKGLAEAKARAEEARRPETKKEPEALPEVPKVRWGWVVAGLIGLVLLAILISTIIPSGRSPEFAFWAADEVIMPGGCTFLHWEVPEEEFVRLDGPGFGSDELLPPVGEAEVCPAESAVYELKNPD